tara:strand:+ start:1143 stop:1718 length:576 start_codon:yes stop_codon:yes gene_type:complete
MKLIFATHNTYKVEELKQLIPKSIYLLSLNDIGCHLEIEETGKSLGENAEIKADFIRFKYGLDCFADDSGLEIEVLDGAPGVRSARYAGPQRDMKANIEKVWEDLNGIKHPKAWFRSVFYIHFCGKEYQLSGRVEGSIIYEIRGNKGFGYDPIFVPKGYKKTFAELGEDVKNKISHRAIAARELIKILSLQ